MRIVLDTNVLISGLLRPFGAPGEIARMVASETILLCFDARILTEYRDVLARPKFRLDQQELDVFLNHIEFSGILAAAQPLAHPLPDRNDEPFLEAAIAAQADYLVTGSGRHFPELSRRGIRVVTPTEFPEEYRKTKLSEVDVESQVEH